MADSKVSTLTEAVYPLGGSHWMYGVQSGNPKKVNPRRVGGLQLLDDPQIASNSPSLDFVNGFDGSCDVYELVLAGLQPVSSGFPDLLVQVTKDGGSTFETTHYSWTRYASQAEDKTASGGDSPNSLTEAAILLWPSCPNTAGETFSARLRFFNFNVAANLKQMVGESHAAYSGPSRPTLRHYGATLSGIWDDMSNAANGIRVKYSSGNISIGKGWLFGLPS